MASQGGKLGPEFTYDLSALKRVDPALVRYTEAEPVALDLAEPRGLARTADGRLLVAGDQKVEVLAEGKKTAELEAGGPARAVAEGPEERLYVALADRVTVLDPSGRRLATWPSLGERAYLTAVAVGAESVFVADAGGRVVHRFDLRGRPLGRIGEKDVRRHAPGLVVPSPFLDVALGPEEMLWITNPGRRRVECYTHEGDFRFDWGTSSMKIEGFCGCCNPTHLAIDASGNFYTSEKGLVRVKRYDPQGVFQCVVAPPAVFADGTTGLDLALEPDGRVRVLDPRRRQVRTFVPKKDGGTGKTET